MVRIHQGASVIAVDLGNNWEPFLFCVLKSVLKPEAKQRLVITSLATLGTVLLFGLVSYALPFLLHQPFKRIKELWHESKGRFALYLFYLACMLTFGAAEGLMASVAVFYTIELFKYVAGMVGFKIGRSLKDVKG